MPTSDRAIKRGDIVVVPFPYSDQLAEKRRPALVVSGNSFNTKSGYLWVVMITSKVDAPASDIVPLSHPKTGLSKPSVVRAAKLATIEASRVIRVAGKVEPKIMNAVKKAMDSILA